MERPTLVGVSHRHHPHYHYHHHPDAIPNEIRYLKMCDRFHFRLVLAVRSIKITASHMDRFQSFYKTVV